MRTTIFAKLSALALAALLAVAQPAAAAPRPLPDNVEVAFGDPAKFSDDRPGRLVADGALVELGGYLRREAARRIPADARLSVTITDLQRAGIVLPSRRSPGDEIRIVRDSDTARIDLAFRLVGPDGAVLEEGTRRLRTLDLQAGRRLRHRDEPLGDEKTLLDRWLAGEFPAPRPDR